MIRYYRYFVEMSISRYHNYVDKPTSIRDNEIESEAIALKELTVNKNDAGQRLDRFVGKAVPLLPESLLQKYIRLKRIKVNGKDSDHTLENGYAVISVSKGETTINVCFDEKLCEICANSKVEADIGRVCIMKGNILYCAEGADNNGEVDFVIAENANPVINGENIEVQTTSGKKAILIPYYKRNNRVSDNTSDSKMAVWFKKENMPKVTNTKDRLYGYYKIY